MGTSGTKLFDDDVACDVRDQYIELLSSGVAPPDATATLRERWGPAVEDPDDGPTFWLALAATQWKYGVLQPEVREQALAVIVNGSDLARWEGAAAQRRAKVLTDLQRTLESPQPAPRRPKRRRAPEPPPRHELLSPSGRSRAAVWQISGPDSPFGPKAQVIMETDGPHGRGGGHVCVLEGLHDQVQLHFDGEDTLIVRYPADVPLVDARPTFFYSGTTIRCVYEPLPAVIR